MMYEQPLPGEVNIEEEQKRRQQDAMHQIRQRMVQEYGSYFLQSLLANPKMDVSDPNLATIAVRHADNLIDAVDHLPRK